MKNQFNHQSVAEEIANSLTHGLGMYLSVAALAVMIAHATKINSSIHLISISIYGTSLIMLYSSSMFYHAFWSVRLKKIFNIFDHISIYYLIAGTYTPILMTIPGNKTWLLLTLQWAIAFAGTIIKIFFTGRYKKLSTLLYLLMGWLFVIDYKTITSAMPDGLFPWMLCGGLCYSIGVIFYLWKN